MWKYSKEIADAVKEYIESINMGYLFDEEDGVIRYLVKPDSKMNKLPCEILLEENAFLVTSYFNIDVAENQREIFAGLLNKINENLTFTSFVFNMDKNEVYCQCYTNCMGVVPSREIINSALFEGVILAVKYGDLFIAVAEGKTGDEELQKFLDENPEY